MEWEKDVYSLPKNTPHTAGRATKVLRSHQALTLYLRSSFMPRSAFSSHMSTQRYLNRDGVKIKLKKEYTSLINRDIMMLLMLRSLIK